MPTTAAIVGAFGALIIGDGILLLLDRIAGVLDSEDEDSPEISVIGGTSSIGLWASLIFVVLLVGLVYGLIRIVLPLVNYPLTPGNHLILMGGSFILGILFGMARGEEAPPAFIATIFMFSLVSVGYSVLRWLFSEVVTLPAATSDFGILLIGLFGALFAVGMIVDADRVIPRAQNRSTNTAKKPADSPGISAESVVDSPPVSSGASTVSPEATSHSGGEPHGSPRPKSRVHPDQFTGKVYDWTYSSVPFDDIGGYYDVKRVLVDEVVEPMRAARRGDDRYERFGIEPERGILLYGPPGTGKTLFARGLAGELHLPFVELSPADVTSKWINEGPDRIKRLFDEAAELGPCIIFIDEAEHLFGARAADSRNTHAEDRKVTTEFLVHLTRADREAIVVAATNRPEDIDPAILRPGRLTAHYEIGLPDSEGRHAILQSKLSGVPSSLSGEQLAELATHTRGFSGADLENLVDVAKRTAAKRDGTAVKLEDFPSFETLDRRVEERERRSDSATLPDPDDPSRVVSEDDGAQDDDPAVGFQ